MLFELIFEWWERVVKGKKDGKIIIDKINNVSKDLKMRDR